MRSMATKKGPERRLQGRSLPVFRHRAAGARNTCGRVPDGPRHRVTPNHPPGPPMTLGNMRELSFPHARHFSEEPEPHSIDDVRDARIVVDRDIAYGH